MTLFMRIFRSARLTSIHEICKCGYVCVRKLLLAELTMTMKIKVINPDENIPKNFLDICGAKVGPSRTQNGSVRPKFRAEIRILN